MEDLIDGRCGWAGRDPLYVRYHDEEWGRLVTDDRVLFEFLVLEGAQAGLAWITVLRKREGYREAFHDFDVDKVAAMTMEDVERLKTSANIVRNRLKIESAIKNARLFIDIQREFGSFYGYIRSFFPQGVPVINHRTTLSDIPATSTESDAISRDMYRRGFRFFGSTICYAFLQATGFIDDHLEGCMCRRSDKPDFN